MTLYPQTYLILDLKKQNAFSAFTQIKDQLDIHYKHATILSEKSFISLYKKTFYELSDEQKKAHITRLIQTQNSIIIIDQIDHVVDVKLHKDILNLISQTPLKFPILLKTKYHEFWMDICSGIIEIQNNKLKMSINSLKYQCEFEKLAI